ncbi:MAG TPA: hypothetical protein VHL78_06220 [Actinomycetota bacterium]|nr:hypothetical protein [Actinomycetota bacterium]
MEPGAWIVAGSAAVGVAAAFLLRGRLPSWAVGGVLGAAGAGLGWGGMLLRPAPSAGEVAVAVAALAALVPAHVRIVLGPLGRPPGPPRARG